MGPVPEVDSTVDVPDTVVPLSIGGMALLQQQFPDDVILASNHHAVDIYSEVLQFVADHISINN